MYRPARSPATGTRIDRWPGRTRTVRTSSARLEPLRRSVTVTRAASDGQNATIATRRPACSRSLRRSGAAWSPTTSTAGGTTGGSAGGGPSGARTVTENAAVAIWSYASVAVHVTVVVPIGKR